jgi:hypothetical protein
MVREGCRRLMGSIMKVTILKGKRMGREYWRRINSYLMVLLRMIWRKEGRLLLTMMMIKR